MNKYLRRETALICAARTGQLDCVRHLLNYGADTERRDGEGHTALWCAVREQQEEVVTYLIHRYMGAMVNQRIENPLLAHIITMSQGRSSTLRG